MLRPASASLRWLYCLSAFSLILPIAITNWINITFGRGPIGVFGLTLWAIFAACTLWRIYRVATVASTLQSYVCSGFLKVLRIAGIIGMVLSVIYISVRLGYTPLLRFLFPEPSADGIEYYVVGVYLALYSNLAPAGLVLFEFSRLLGFERHSRGN